MKVLLVLASCLAVAYAGVGILDTYQEKDALNLWLTYCGNGGDGGTDGNINYYCKNAFEDTVEVLQHSITVTPAPEAPRQVVFVRPPSTNYKHNVIINGDGGQAQKTTIYVLPQKNSHTLDYVDNRAPGVAPQKPSLYFLKNNPTGSGYAPANAYLPPK